MCVALNISLTKRPQGLRENGERRVPMAPQLLVGQRYCRDAEMRSPAKALRAMQPATASRAQS